QPPSAPNPTTTTTTTTSFAFPPHYSFPAFFTLQPVLATRHSQLTSWSTLIQTYCRHHHLFTLSLIDALPTPLFTNAALPRALSLRDARVVISWMASVEGGSRAEWMPTTTTTEAAAAKKKSSSAGAGAAGADGGAGAGAAADEDDGAGAKCWIYWRRPEEWAVVLEEWVERTAQRGSVLTLYEITESDATRREEFWGMEPELLARSLGVCVKRGKAQIFGSEGSEGVK
ncbi:ESCRT-II complex subunit-domain-containing protein, partial [Massariosphaeria phaeospora]